MNERASTVSGHVEADVPMTSAGDGRSERELDPVSREWLASLRDDGEARNGAIERLHALLLRGARFEVGRRQASLPHLRGRELDDIALEAADDALMSVLRRLDDFRGLSRFTTWAYKFALYEAAVKLRRRAWQEREVPMEQEGWDLVSSIALEPDLEVEQAELLTAIRRAIDLAPLAPSAPRPHRARRQRRSDRRSRRASRYDPRGALQDIARRAAQAAQTSRRRRILALRPAEGGDPVTRSDTTQMLDRLLGPAGAELGCDACFEELDRYVDLQLLGHAADLAVPGMREHLAGCPACREEHESLSTLAAHPA